MLYGILIFVQMLISVLLVVVILMQASKGGGLAGIGGGLSSSTMFGGRSAATFLSRATTVLAVLFMLNCLGLAVLSKSATALRSVTQTESVQPVSPVPSPGGEAIPTGQGTPSPAGGGAQQTPSPAGGTSP